MGRQGDSEARSSEPRGGNRRSAPLFGPVVWESSLLSWFLEAPPGRKELVSAEASSFLMLGVEDATVRPITGNTTSKARRLSRKGLSLFPPTPKLALSFEPCVHPGIHQVIFTGIKS